MNVMRTLASAACAVLLGANVVGVPANAQQANSRVAYSSEKESLPNPVAVPECARRWLARDAHVSLHLDRLRLSLLQLPSAWFVAGAVNLGIPNENKKLMVVMS